MLGSGSCSYTLSFEIFKCPLLSMALRCGLQVYHVINFSLLVWREIFHVWWVISPRHFCCIILIIFTLEASLCILHYFYVPFWYKGTILWIYHYIINYLLLEHVIRKFPSSLNFFRRNKDI